MDKTTNEEMMGYSCSCSLKIICLFLYVFIGATSSQSTKCPFRYLYHFGDGVTDIGNSIKILPIGPLLPAARLPYGRTFPGRPTGRWCDGLIDIDYAAEDFGVPIAPYLSKNATSSNGIIFSVAGSPVLDNAFFALRGVTIPPFAVSLNKQLLWFKSYLKSICSTPTDCANRLRDSLILMGDIEANDLGYALTQGKSIQEAQSYVTFVIREVVNALRELIRMGATRFAIPGNAPLGCYPYVLTALQTNHPAAYDELGCLKSVNDLIVSKDNDLQQAINNITMEFRNVRILFAPYYDAVRTIIRQASSTGTALKSCCGIGGRYNYNRDRFCGSPGVPVCPNPNQYIYWDGLHFTQEAYRRIVEILIAPALPALNCTS